MILWIFLIGMTIGAAGSLLTILAHKSERSVKHEFSSHSMPDIDIDEELLAGGRRDKATSDFKDGN